MALHVPVVTVPRVVIEDCPTHVDLIVRFPDPSVVMLVLSVPTFKVVPEKLRAVPAVIAPEEENIVKVKDVEPSVIGFAVVKT